MGFLSALDRFNRAHPWSHNDAFAGFVLRQARAVRRRGGSTAVDVGCGTGNLVARLARVFPDVRGIEPDPATAAIAAARFSGSGTVRIEQRHFQEEDRAKYDFVVFVASLHHMLFAEALRRARMNLRPGGRIVIVGLARETPADTPRSLISLALNPLVGLLRHPRRAELPPSHMRAPTTAADDSFDEIRHIAQTVLPGICLRRRLFWRYTATWTQPA
jgi:SAM-dependent methyltransferase